MYVWFVCVWFAIAALLAAPAGPAVAAFADVAASRHERANTLSFGHSRDIILTTHVLFLFLSVSASAGLCLCLCLLLCNSACLCICALAGAHGRARLHASQRLPSDYIVIHVL